MHLLIYLPSLLKKIIVAKFKNLLRKSELFPFMLGKTNNLTFWQQCLSYIHLRHKLEIFQQSLAKLFSRYLIKMVIYSWILISDFLTSTVSNSLFTLLSQLFTPRGGARPRQRTLFYYRKKTFEKYTLKENFFHFLRL